MWSRALATVLPLALGLAGCPESPGVGAARNAADGAPHDSAATDATDATDSGGMGGGDGDAPDGCLPAPEACNTRDDDCDGLVDEGTDPATACGVAVGACQAGTLACVAGSVTCVGAVEPTQEACNGADDDCDGDTDEATAGSGEACEVDGACTGGVTTCVDGALVCVPPAADAPETCNGADDDCDGTIDEAPADAGGPCGAQGACAGGTLLCVDGALVCDGLADARPETCNGEDDDCDGTVDEAVPESGRVCEAGRACGAGTVACVEGVLACIPDAMQAGDDEICDGEDNDCDGRVDEADPRVDQPCGEEVGACEPGALACVAGQILCLGGTSAVPEVCDEVDNDCDGEVDEAEDFGGVPCPVVGEGCAGDADCVSRLCLDDSGARYCSRVCEPDGEACEEGTSCDEVRGRMVCARGFDDCLTDRDCPDADLGCRLVPPEAPDELGAECRPLDRAGLGLGADCSGEGASCANGMCLAGVARCTSLCVTPEECPAGFSCALTPFFLGDGEILDLGFCLESCGGDDDCSLPANRLCQYGLQADRMAVVGYCDAPFDGAAPGEPCDLNADPPARCDHGYCITEGDDRFCSQGCADAGDCLPNWRCEETPLGQGLSFGTCRRP